MTHADWLIWLADDLLPNRPRCAARLIEIAHDLRLLQELADEIVGSAMEEARREVTDTKARAAASLAKICKEHGRQ